MLQNLSAAVRRAPIGPRLVAGFLLVAAACAFVGYKGVQGLAEARGFQVNASANLLPSVLNLDMARAGALRVQRGERTAIFAARRDDEKAAQAARGNIDAGWKTLDEGLKAYAVLPMIAKEAAAYKDLQAALDEWKRDAQVIMNHLDRKEVDKAEAAVFAELKTANRLNDCFQDVMAIQDEIAKDETAQATALYEGTRATMWYTVGGAVVLAVGLGLVLTASVVRPLNQTVGVLEAVAKGDLSGRAEAGSRDEIGRLAVALNTAIGTLQAAREKDAEAAGQLAAVGKAQAVVEFKPDGTVAAANDNFLATVGYSLAEIQGRHHSQFVDPAEASGHAYREFWSRLARGDAQEGEFRRVAKGGKEIWIRGGYYPIPGPDGKVAKVVKYASDITAAKAGQVEAARTKTMLDGAPINVMFADREFKIRYANAATVQTLRGLEKYLPVRADALIGQSIDVFHKRPDHQRRLVGDPKNLPHTAQIQVGPETLELNVSPVLDQNREYLGAMVAWSVVTEKLAMEKQIRESTERAKAEAADLQNKVDRIGEGVAALAAGDFTYTIPDLGDDNVGKMAAALNQAVGLVKDALEGVREVSVQVAEASGQLAAAGDGLSTGAQEQASSLEETASTLEEITATVRQNSDNAQQARQLAATSKEVAEKGGQVVGGAVEAMGEINQSSKKIADIITAIDEIAFQTNLLALNAAVEAARAGEQGRGFAVVAAEVRNLAQRSATAAKEIKALIQDSVKKVEAGSDLVNRSGATLNEIVSSVKRVTDIVGEIAAASKEQASGIEQVNKAVTQMDTVTQQNAGQTEELSATAQTLTEQARHLQGLLAKFKLGEAGHAAKPVAHKPAKPAKPAAQPKPPAKPRHPALAMNGVNGHHDLDSIGRNGDGIDGFEEF